MKKLVKNPKKDVKITPENAKTRRGKMQDGEVDVDLELENRPISIIKGERRIGCSKGATVPTVAYGNIKIAVWEEKIVPDNDSIARKELQNISNYLDDWLQTEIDEALKGIK